MEKVEGKEDAAPEADGASEEEANGDTAKKEEHDPREETESCGDGNITDGQAFGAHIFKECTLGESEHTVGTEAPEEAQDDEELRLFRLTWVEIKEYA